MGYLSKTVLSSNIHIRLENLPPLENPLLEKVEQNGGLRGQSPRVDPNPW